LAKEAGNKDITLDDLLKIVESAASTIERLQAVNASLIEKIRDVESAAERAAADAEAKSRQMEELEKSEAALREDAEWCRWFRDKYGSSTFFSHIEREYQHAHHPENPAGSADQSGIAPDAS
jgi:chemotaxis regulatin CheY-phosphate phosphatase CheZ